MVICKIILNVKRLLQYYKLFNIGTGTISGEILCRDIFLTKFVVTGAIIFTDTTHNKFKEEKGFKKQNKERAEHIEYNLLKKLPTLYLSAVQCPSLTIFHNLCKFRDTYDIV